MGGISPSEIGQIYAKETDGDFDIIIPETGFIREYYEYAVELTEAPPFFHAMVAFSLISACVGRNIYLPFGAGYIYPNLWIVLIAPSSLYKKTTAINIGRGLLHKADKSIILPDEFTPEALLETLVQNPSGLFIWSEFGAALARLERSYMTGMKETFTDLYDCPPEYIRKIKTTTFEIKGPCISILAASSISWLRKQIDDSDVMGGFLARFVFVPESRRSSLKPVPPTPDENEKAQLVATLKRFTQINGIISLDAKALEIYKTWYIESDRAMQGESDIEMLAPFYTRLNTYVMKFAMLYQISGNESKTVAGDSMFRACMLVDRLKENIKNLLADEIVFGKDAREIKKVEKIIRKAVIIDHSSLLKKSKFDAAVLGRIVRTLGEQGMIAIKNEGTGREQRKTYQWIGQL